MIYGDFLFYSSKCWRSTRLLATLFLQLYSLFKGKGTLEKLKEEKIPWQATCCSHPILLQVQGCQFQSWNFLTLIGDYCIAPKEVFICSMLLRLYVFVKFSYQRYTFCFKYVLYFILLSGVFCVVCNPIQKYLCCKKDKPKKVQLTEWHNGVKSQEEKLYQLNSSIQSKKGSQSNQ